VERFDAAAEHSLMGHGFFSSDGALLYTVEAHNETGAGKLVVRDADRWAPVGALDTQGIGPHQAQLMPDGTTAVVANGGILTRPETGRQKLNLDTMESSLTYIELATGVVVERQTVLETKSSIRHLEVADDGTVAFGVQVQRDATEHNAVVPLAAVHRMGSEVSMLDTGIEAVAAMNDYVGSVAVNSTTRIAGFTSPRGDRAAFWNVDSGAFVGEHALADVSGITVSRDQSTFIVSNSLGELRHLDAESAREDRSARSEHPNIRWDNHLITAVA
ncbi:MAG: DUF1513 domain-containing protein, partial [Myxococcota bacterium]